MIKAKLPITEEQVFDLLDGLSEFWDMIPGTTNTYMDVLLEHYADEIPYGIAKARDGDPDEWLYHRLVADTGYSA